MKHSALSQRDALNRDEKERWEKPSFRLEIAPHTNRRQSELEFPFLDKYFNEATLSCKRDAREMSLSGTNALFNCYLIHELMEAERLLKAFLFFYSSEIMKLKSASFKFQSIKTFFV